MKQKLILGLIGLLLVAYFSWLIFGSGDWFFPHSKNAPNRVAMLKIRERINLGDGYESVLRSYWQHASSDLMLYAGSPQTWTVSMPNEFGARNWVLFIEFAEGKVSAVKVRTSDGPPPNGAPADVGG
jgi:hypothetical protein